jgi:ABC-type uncharacterized transport system permease subunit
MILLHVAVATLYALAAWALWPHAAPVPAGPKPAVPSPPKSAWMVVVLPVALLLHAWLAAREIAAPEGLDLSLPHALSVVAGLVALVAWASGLLRTLPAIGTVVLPVAAVASLVPAVATLVPAFGTIPRPFPYGGEPWAALHVGVALVAYALFLVAALQALVLMGLEKRLHRRLPNPGASGLPPLLTLERFLFRLVTVGFVLLTLTLASGMLFSEQIFGKPVTFGHQVGHKIVFSVLSWLTFCALLWGRWRYGWRGRVALRWIIAGTIFVFLAYLGSKFVLEVLLGR